MHTYLNLHFNVATSHNAAAPWVMDIASLYFMKHPFHDLITKC